MWVFYSLVGAVSQAFGSAIKKQSLQKRGMNNVIGCIAFMTAGIVFGIINFVDTGHVWMVGLSHRFWEGMFWSASLNIVGAWFLYRALDLAEFSRLMPFMTLTSVTIVIPPMIFLGEVPSRGSLFGIVIVVVGAMLMSWDFAKLPDEVPETRKEMKRREDNRRGILSFMITALCYTVTPTAAKISIQESSVLFASFVVYALMALGFFLLVLFFGERVRLRSVLVDPKWRPFLLWSVVTGLVAVLGDGSVGVALSMASVSSVMAIKRLMPLFAFLIGYYYFKERTELPRKLVATVLMVSGALLITVL